MHLLAVSCDQRSASVALRERLHWSSEEIPAALRALSGDPIQEIAMLCTCNRTDVYLSAADPALAVNRVLQQFSEHSGLSQEEVECLVRITIGAEEVCRHVCRVASGMESEVLGETQVLNQVKEAYLLATRAGTVGKLLHGLFHQTLRCARRVHAETRLAAAPVSVGSAAVDAAKAVLGPLEGVTVAVLGAGEMAETVVRRLHESGCAHLFVINRSPERAAELAARHGGETRPAQELGAVLGQVDVVITSTAARQPVLRPSDIPVGRRLLVLDIAVPRNVDPEVGAIPGVSLRNIDDLEEVALRGRSQRLEELKAAEAIVAAAVADFHAWWIALGVIPAIRSLREHFNAVAEAELERSLQSMGDVDPRQRRAMRRLAHAMVHQLLNEPLARLRELAETPHGHDAVRALAEVFGLPWEGAVEWPEVREGTAHS